MACDPENASRTVEEYKIPFGILTKPIRCGVEKYRWDFQINQRLDDGIIINIMTMMPLT